jgi:hypothetical protein
MLRTADWRKLMTGKIRTLRVVKGFGFTNTRAL